MCVYVGTYGSLYEVQLFFLLTPPPHSCPPLPVQHQADYGDIIKTAITHCLRYSVAQTSYEWSHVLVEALKSEYQQLTEEQGGNTTVDFTSASWGDLRVCMHLRT